MALTNPPRSTLRSEMRKRVFTGSKQHEVELAGADEFAEICVQFVRKNAWKICWMKCARAHEQHHLPLRPVADAVGVRIDDGDEESCSANQSSSTTIQRRKFVLKLISRMTELRQSAPIELRSVTGSSCSCCFILPPPSICECRGPHEAGQEIRGHDPEELNDKPLTRAPVPVDLPT